MLAAQAALIQTNLHPLAFYTQTFTSPPAKNNLTFHLNGNKVRLPTHSMADSHEPASFAYSLPSAVIYSMPDSLLSMEGHHHGYLVSSVLEHGPLT